MVRGAAYLYAAGGVLVCVSLVLPHHDAPHTAGVLVPAGLAFLTAAAMLVLGPRVPSWVFPVATAAGSVLIGVCIYFGEDAGPAYRSMYVWVTLYAFYFFGRRMAIVQVVFAAATFGAVLLADDLGPAAEVAWVMTAGTIAVAGWLVGRLSRQVREQSALLAERRLFEERERHALEINDNVVQGLSVAKYSLAAGQTETAARVVDETLARARRIITDQLGDGEEPVPVRPGDLVRRTPSDAPPEGGPEAGPGAGPETGERSR